MMHSAIGLASVALLIGAHAVHATCPSFTAPSIRERLLPGDAVPPSAPPHSEAEIQARWATLKAALKRGDIPAALECVHSRSRDRYDQMFRAMRSSLADIDKILTTIQLDEADKYEAFYEMVRPGPGGIQQSYEVRFAVDDDGVWRLRSF